jgi:hypothetical protein
MDFTLVHGLNIPAGPGEISSERGPGVKTGLRRWR